MGSITILPMPSVFYLENNNQQYITCGPVVDGQSIVDGVLIPNPTFITDLTITVSLYLNRDITNPAARPGTLITAFGTAGNLAMAYTAGGVYLATSNAFTAVPNSSYVLVFDAPVSGAGYQFHLEKSCVVLTRQN